MSVDDLLQNPVRLLLAGALLYVALDGGGLSPATSRGPTVVARTIIQNTGSAIRPRTEARRPWAGQCPPRLECDGFVWL
jgi:hypothetical protein